jgi:hypothetical protein
MKCDLCSAWNIFCGKQWLYPIHNIDDINDVKSHEQENVGMIKTVVRQKYLASQFHKIARELMVRSVTITLIQNQVCISLFFHLEGIAMPLWESSGLVVSISYWFNIALFSRWQKTLWTLTGTQDWEFLCIKWWKTANTLVFGSDSPKVMVISRVRIDAMWKLWQLSVSQKSTQ